MMPRLHAGDCKCGAVRFAMLVEPGPVSICPCRICQKAFGAYFGTTLTFVCEDSGIAEFAVGAFDHPETFPPTKELWASARIPHFDRLNDLPERPEDEPGLDDMVKEIAATNHQHLDHETGVWPLKRCTP